MDFLAVPSSIPQKKQDENTMLARSGITLAIVLSLFPLALDSPTTSSAEALELLFLSWVGVFFANFILVRWWWRSIMGRTIP